MLDFLNNISFFNGLSAAIQAVLLLIIAFIAAAIVRVVVKKVMSKLLAKKSADEDAELAQTKASTVNIIGNLAFAVVFLLFLPGALEKLGVTSVTSPIAEMTSKFVGFIPNIIAAVLLVVFGFFLAKLARQLLTLLLRKTPIDNLQKKYGVNADSQSSLSGIIGQIVYVIIMVIFIIAALDVLSIDAISAPAKEMLTIIISFIPRIFGALIVILVGVFLARLVCSLLVNLLVGTGLDAKTKGLMPKNDKGEPAIMMSALIGIIVKVVINLFFIVAGLHILEIEVLTNIGTAIIAYLPNILAAIIIVVLAWILAGKAQKAILKANRNSTGLASAAKVLIIILATFMALSQLGIAPRIVETLFTFGIIGIAAAFAIAFGIGGREWAAKKLADMDEKVKEQLKKDDSEEAAEAPAEDAVEVPAEAAADAVEAAADAVDTAADTAADAVDAVKEAKE